MLSRRLLLTLPLATCAAKSKSKSNLLQSNPCSIQDRVARFSIMLERYSMVESVAHEVKNYYSGLIENNYVGQKEIENLQNVRMFVAEHPEFQELLDTMIQDGQEVVYLSDCFDA